MRNYQQALVCTKSAQNPIQNKLCMLTFQITIAALVDMFKVEYLKKPNQAEVTCCDLKQTSGLRTCK